MERSTSPQSAPQNSPQNPPQTPPAPVDLALPTPLEGFFEERAARERDLAWRARGLAREHLPLRKIAARLGITAKRAWEFVHGVAREKRAAESADSHRVRHKKNALERWVECHPEVVLPRATREIAMLTGIPARSVSAHLTQRRARLRRWCARIGDPTTRVLVWTTSDGTKLTSAAISRWEWAFDEFANSVSLDVTTICGELFVIPILSRWDFEVEWRRAARRGEAPQ